MSEDFDKLAPTTPGRVHDDWDAAKERIHDEVLTHSGRRRRRPLVGIAAAVLVVAVAFGASHLLGGDRVREAVPAGTPTGDPTPHTSSRVPATPTASAAPATLPAVPPPPEPLVYGHPDLCEDPVQGSVPQGPDQLAAAAFDIPGFQFLWESEQQNTFNVAVRGDTEAARQALIGNYHGPLCIGTMEGPTRAEVEAVRKEIESVAQQVEISAVLTPDGVRVEVTLTPDAYRDPAIHAEIRNAAGEAVNPWLVIQQTPTELPASVAPVDSQRISEVLFNATLAVPGVYASSELLPDGHVDILYLESHPRALEFIAQVNASAGEASRAIVWTGTYYSQDLIQQVGQAAAAEAASKGIDAQGGTFDAEAREYQMFTPDAPSDRFLSDQYMGDVRITVRLVEGAIMLEAGPDE